MCPGFELDHEYPHVDIDHDHPHVEFQLDQLELVESYLNLKLYFKLVLELDELVDDHHDEHELSREADQEQQAEAVKPSAGADNELEQRAEVRHPHGQEEDQG